MRTPRAADAHEECLTRPETELLRTSAHVPRGNSDPAVAEIHCEHDGTLSQTQQAVLLLTWLIVLIRTRDDVSADFEWTVRSADGSEQDEAIQQLSSKHVIHSLHDSVGDVESAIVAIIGQTGKAVLPSTASFILSTSSLSCDSGAKQTGEMFHLGIRIHQQTLHVYEAWRGPSILDFAAARYIESFADIYHACTADRNASIQQLLRPTAFDLDTMWQWNAHVPPTLDFCMHDAISRRAQKQPNAVAIDSWDGILTYGQVDRFSTIVAHKLHAMGVQLHDVTPVCFEKSRWTIVAVLGVMKAGATMALMDPTLPLARLQNMATQVGAKTMISSRTQKELSGSILPTERLLIVDADLFAGPQASADGAQLEAVPVSALMYIIFTSGSTGTPKGVKISHGTYTSSAIPRAKAVGYDEHSRVLDFASYAFDVSIDSMLLTLHNGGCLCIPSDDDRMNDINGTMKRMRVNYAGITPSVARILDQEVIESLTALGLGGEAVSARDCALWGRYARIVIGYGPCECTIGCTVNSSAATGRDYVSIGPGNGAVIWIVDAEDHNSLVPVGAVGELLVEGPIVGQGYLGDPEKTAAAFIEDPEWLVAGHGAYAGRRGRMYKTGDLAKFDLDGSGGLVFVGRKDSQVKLRGQRVELGEIESQLRDRLPADVTITVEVITPENASKQSTLVAFLALQTTQSHDHTEMALAELSAQLQSQLSQVNSELTEVLPRYMVPTAYIPVNFIPILVSGKTDRKRLRHFGTTVDLRLLEQHSRTTSAQELTETEHKLLMVWTEVLGIDAESVEPETNFFILGGDSLAAMKMATACKSQGLSLTVTEIFANSSLRAMASVARAYESVEREELPAFALVSRDAQVARQEAAQVCNVELDAVEDIYPCTPTQESLFTFALKSREVYVAQRVAEIPAHIGLDAWKAAWETVVAATPILRTRVAQLEEPGLQQVVVRQSITWKQPDDLDSYLENDRQERMELGEGLARYAMVERPGRAACMVWTIHHVLYDGWSEPLVLQKVSEALGQQVGGGAVPIRDFVRYVRGIDQHAMRTFWAQELEGAVGPQFPPLPYRDYLPIPDATVERRIPLPAATGSPFTMATTIRGAWALVSSLHIAADDIVFGETLTGRNIGLPGVESIIGPLIATVPIRIRVDRTVSVSSYLQQIQQAMSNRVEYQHMGMQYIRRVSSDAQRACETPTGIVIQLEMEYTGAELGFQAQDAVREALHFNPYPLMLAFGIHKSELHVCANFDSSLVGAPQMERMLAQFEVAWTHLSTAPLSHTLGSVQYLPEAEVDQIWSWNQLAPLAIDKDSGRLQANSGIAFGSSYPPAVVPWLVQSQNVGSLVPIGCVGQLWLEAALLPGEPLDSPSWLQKGSKTCAGRRNRLWPTGDLAKLSEDGSLRFVRRNNHQVGQEHEQELGLEELAEHISRQLPSEIRSTLALRSGVQSELAQSQPEVLVLIERPSSTDEGVVEILPPSGVVGSGDTSRQPPGVTLCAEIPLSLAVSLRRLDKTIQDSPTLHVIRLAYVVVDELPTRDPDSLREFASSIRNEVLQEHLERVKALLASSSTYSSLTTSESILRSSWSTLLGMPAEQIDVDDNFFRLGGDSVLAMKLVSSLRAQGHDLTVAEVFQRMRLGDAAKVLRLHSRPTARQSPAYKPFSLLPPGNIEAFLQEFVRPKLQDPSHIVRDVCPVTNTQHLDILATISKPRTSVQYTLLYFDQSYNPQRLIEACTRLVDTHEILRTVFVDYQSSFLQVVLEGVDHTPLLHQTAEDLAGAVAALCKQDAESDFRLGSPFLKFSLVEDSSKNLCLILRLSHAQYDGVSLPRLLEDLSSLYAGGEISKSVPFQSYVAQIRAESTQAKAVKYWRDLLDGSSQAVITASPTATTDEALFRSQAINNVDQLGSITRATVLTAAWALVLARRLHQSDVAFGNVSSGRTSMLANGADVQGPCYNIAPVRVRFEPGWTADDLLRYVQAQTGASAEYDFLDHDVLARDCTQWGSGSRMMNSLVHYQSAEDTNNTMPFGGGSCNLDAIKPHGDAASPWKAVTFVQEGQLHVGIVGSEKDQVVVEELLDELSLAMQELTSGGSQRELLSGVADYGRMDSPRQEQGPTQYE